LRILLAVGFIVLLLAVLYRTLRPMISTARQFIRAIRHFQQVTNSPSHPTGAAEKLIQCATCDTWIPQSRALTAHSMDYCSRECIKRGGVAKRRNSAA